LKWITQPFALSSRPLLAAYRRAFFGEALPTVEAPRLSNSSARALKPVGRDLAQIVGGGLVLVFLYCGSDWHTEPSFIAWAHGLPDGPLRAPTLWLAEHLRIFSNAGE
jgi:hypothetical protein